MPHSSGLNCYATIVFISTINLTKKSITELEWVSMALMKTSLSEYIILAFLSRALQIRCPSGMHQRFPKIIIENFMSQLID